MKNDDYGYGFLDGFAMGVFLMGAFLILLTIFLSGCSTPEHSPMFDQTLMLNGHYELVYPDANPR